MEGILTIQFDGTVVDSRTGLAYGRVRRDGDWWVGTVLSRDGGRTTALYRPSRREAAVAVAIEYLIGPES